jgi:hypothetical protein
MKALEHYEITKQMFELEFLDGRELTDIQWANIVEEINGRVSNYLDELLGVLMQEIEEGEWDEEDDEEDE